MRVSFVLPLVLATLTPGLASAAPIGTGAADSKVYSGMTMDEVEAAVKEAGYTYMRVPSGSSESIDAETPEGLKFSIMLANCPESGERRCASINMVSFTFNETANMTLKRVNEWNREQAWGVRGMLFSDGTSGVTMNLAIDGGVTVTWLKNRFENYNYYIKSFSDLIQGVSP